MTARPKVLHMISNLMAGGAETMLSKVVRATAGEIEHSVVSMIDGGAIAAELKNAGIPVHFLGAGRNFSAALRIGKIRQIVRAVMPDLVQGWMYHGNIAASVAASARRPPVPVLWNIRQSIGSLRDESFLTLLTILLGTPLSGSPRVIIYNSRRAIEDHERLGYSRKRRVIIANGFDTEAYQPDPAARAALLSQLGLPTDAAIVGRIANFRTYKDYPTLFAAFAAIARANPRAYLIVIGRELDPDNPALRRLIASQPAQDRVRILGERADVARLLPGFDIMLSSSSAEAFPNVLGEAMACAVPTITTDAGDCGEILGDPTRVVPVGDSAALAQKAIEFLALTPERRATIGATDRARVIANFSLEKIAAEYVALWRREAAFLPSSG